MHSKRSKRGKDKLMLSKLVLSQIFDRAMNCIREESTQKSDILKEIIKEVESNRNNTKNKIIERNNRTNRNIKEQNLYSKILSSKKQNQRIKIRNNSEQAEKEERAGKEKAEKMQSKANRKGEEYIYVCVSKLKNAPLLTEKAFSKAPISAHVRIFREGVVEKICRK